MILPAREGKGQPFCSIQSFNSLDEASCPELLIQMLTDYRNALIATHVIFVQCLGGCAPEPTRLTGRICYHTALGSEIMDKVPGLVAGSAEGGAGRDAWS